MKITSYHYWQPNPAWKFSKVELKKMNLMVGDTGTGKTRFLNTVFNLGSAAVGARKPKNGCWEVELLQDGVRYGWRIISAEGETEETHIKEEQLWKWKNDEKISIIERDESSFVYLGQKIPKLAKHTTSISLLKEEDEIKPLHDGFSKIMKRNFSADALTEGFSFEGIWPDLYRDFNELQKLFGSQLGVSARLYVLSRNFPELYDQICNTYKGIFPFILDMQIKDLKSIRPKFRAPGMVPTVAIKEKQVDSWLTSGELSSGMQKVLLILTDVYSMPDGGIYLIDEYENSLGINAINFFPDFLNQLEKEVQFIMTSHHPYIINNIPPENWFIFHRVGSEVKIRYGRQNEEMFSKSKQQRFIQLINDPFYTDGVE